MWKVSAPSCGLIINNVYTAKGGRRGGQITSKRRGGQGHNWPTKIVISIQLTTIGLLIIDLIITNYKRGGPLFSWILLWHSVALMDRPRAGGVNWYLVDGARLFPRPRNRNNNNRTGENLLLLLLLEQKANHANMFHSGVAGVLLHRLPSPGQWTDSRSMDRWGLSSWVWTELLTGWWITRRLLVVR